MTLLNWPVTPRASATPRQVGTPRAQKPPASPLQSTYGSCKAVQHTVTIHRSRGGSFGFGLNDCNTVTEVASDAAHDVQVCDTIVAVDGAPLGVGRLEHALPHDVHMLTILRPLGLPDAATEAALPNAGKLDAVLKTPRLSRRAKIQMEDAKEHRVLPKGAQTWLARPVEEMMDNLLYRC